MTKRLSIEQIDQKLGHCSASLNFQSQSISPTHTQSEVYYPSPVLLIAHILTFALPKTT